MTYTAPPGPGPAGNDYQLGTGQTAPNGMGDDTPPSQWFTGHRYRVPLPREVKRIIWIALWVAGALFVFMFLVPLALYS